VAPPTAGVRQISLQVWERFLVVEQQQNQEISIWVLENDQPLSNMAVRVTLKLPDGLEQIYPMLPTDKSGQSSLLLPAIKAPNGTIIPYKACILAAPELSVCVADFFVIWENP
jgi:hypothetical protein